MKINRFGSMIHLLSPSREGVGGGIASNTLLFWGIDEEHSWGFALTSEKTRKKKKNKVTPACVSHKKNEKNV